jgi:hypothetical protein
LSEEIIPLSSYNVNSGISHSRTQSLSPRISTPSPVRRTATPTINTQPHRTSMEAPRSPKVNGTNTPLVGRPGGGTPRSSIESDIRDAVGLGIQESATDNHDEEFGST